jgi:hypothetical protein
VLNGYPKNVNLGGSNGSRIVTVSTAGYTTHEYQFKANTTSGNMKLVSSRYQDFESSFLAFASASPFRAIPGEAVELTLSEFPYVDAVANVTFGNSTYTKQTWSNIAIPASNGSRIIKDVSTTGLKAGNYQFKVNATSSIGARANTFPGILVLDDIIVEVENSSYLVADFVNVTIRTYPAVSQANLSISFFNTTTFDVTTVLDQNVGP